MNSQKFLTPTIGSCLGIAGFSLETIGLGPCGLGALCCWAPGARGGILRGGRCMFILVTGV